MTQSSTTLAVACPACGLSHAFRAGAAPAGIPHHCPRCGADLVAEGLLKPAAPDAAATDGLPPSAERSAEKRTDDEAHLPPPVAWQSAAVAAFAAVLGWSHATRGMLAAVVSGADLVFHEAGHPIVGVLGSRFLTYLGGTIGQLAIPAAAAFAFARRWQTAAYAVALLWVGSTALDETAGRGSETLTTPGRARVRDLAVTHRASRGAALLVASVRIDAAFARRSSRSRKLGASGS